MITCITLLLGVISCTVPEGKPRLSAAEAAAILAPNQYVYAPPVWTYHLEARPRTMPPAPVRQTASEPQKAAAPKAPWFIDGIYVGDAPSGQWTSTIHTIPTIRVIR